MATLYCAIHRDEDQQAMVGERLSILNHMVYHRCYDLAGLRDFISGKDWLVIWEMETSEDKKDCFFKQLVGIPH